MNQKVLMIINSVRTSPFDILRLIAGGLVSVIVLFTFNGCTLCMVGAAGGAGYTAGEASADKDRRVGDVLSDGAITAKVNAALAANKELSMWDVDVDTHLGVVTLRGYVKDKETITEIIKTTRGVKGVKDVKSQLVIDKGDK